MPGVWGFLRVTPTGLRVHLIVKGLQLAQAVPEGLSRCPGVVAIVPWSVRLFSGENSKLMHIHPGPSIVDTGPSVTTD